MITEKSEKASVIIIENSKRFPVIINHFSALQWLTKAASTDEIRKDIYRIIHVKDGIYFATDGHRLHVYCPDTDELPVNVVLDDGNYRIKSVNAKMIILEKSDDNEYLDVWRVLSYRPANGIPAFNCYSYRNEKLPFGNFIHHLYTNDKRLFNIDYLKDAIFEGNLHFERDAEKDRLIAPIIIGNKDRFAVIQPLSLQ